MQGFNGTIRFEDVQFNGRTRFGDVQFNGPISFAGAQFALGVPEEVVPT
jgi:hypothetical protein